MRPVRPAFARPMLLGMVALGTLGTSAPASAQTPAECAQAYESAQRLRIRKHLRASLEQLKVCAAPACPAAARDDCATWLTEVAQELPSVVITLRGPGGESVTGVNVALDGDPLPTGPGAIDVDPGPHTFRFEAVGQPPIVREITIGEGEKAREVAVTLPGSVTSTSPLLPYVLGGAGVALAVAGSAFEIWGLSKRAAVDACQPPCSLMTYDADKGAAQRTFLAGDLLLGAAISAIAVGTILYFVQRPHLHSTSVEVVGAWPIAGGWLGVAEARF
jgi:hypothetical protein